MNDNKVFDGQVHQSSGKKSEFYEWLRSEHDGQDRVLRNGSRASSKWPRECLRLRLFRVNLLGVRQESW
jgi:hypothetical protein